MNVFRPIFAVLVLTAACSSTSDLGTNVGPGPGANGDAGPDANGDAGSNTNGDTGPNMNGDAASDTNGDASPNAIIDAALDTNGDAAPNTIRDAAPDTNDAAPNPMGIGTLSGVLGGNFVPMSGYGHINDDGSIDLILSDFAGACDSAVANRLHSGETSLQAYGLTGTAPGVFASSQVVKYATVGTCPSGQSVKFFISTYGRATMSKITLSKVTAAQIEGEMSATFDDGSHISGTFTVPTCPSVLSEFVLCY
jgi:hypothetical protein